jgi:hypothetical protein
MYPPREPLKLLRDSACVGFVGWAMLPVSKFLIYNQVYELSERFLAFLLFLAAYDPL